MPNWVYNQLTIDGPSKVLDTLIASHYCESNGFDFNTVIPMPVSLNTTAQIGKRSMAQIDNKQKYGYYDWHDWAIANWGTKWNATNTFITRRRTRIVIEFDTPWSMPVEIYQELSSLYPELIFTLECIEEGGYFCGSSRWVNGEHIEDNITTDLKIWKMYAKKLGRFNQYDEE
jgi:hypothetical protein